MTKKETIIQWIKTDRDYNSGVALYQKHGTNLAFKTMINRYPESQKMLDQLCYELTKEAGINERQLNQLLSKPVVKPEPEPAIEPEKTVNDIPIEELAAMIHLVDISELEYHRALQVTSILNLEPKSRKKDDVLASLEDYKVKKLDQQIPEKIRHTMKLREEFPFLKQKDCPGELKELVADMLTSYDNYTTDHAKLFENISEEEVEELSKTVVENYLENRQIWAELNHYKEHGKVLGEHPLFDWIKRREDIKVMKEGDLAKLRDSLRNNLPRTKKLIKDEPDHKDTEKREKRVEQFEKELDLVNQLLKIESAENKK